MFENESFEYLENILEESRQLKEWGPYENLVITVYSEKAEKINIIFFILQSVMQ
ncbi:MAG: hypothetical protein LBN31_15405 [Hungatella sp.]|jgi:hypothetical protein|nr:hypothetical protein [Hungatella sp.]